jgi:hypothetical protein
MATIGRSGSSYDFGWSVSGERFVRKILGRELGLA